MEGNICSVINQIFLITKKPHIKSNNRDVGRIKFNVNSNKEHQKLLKEKKREICIFDFASSETHPTPHNHLLRANSWGWTFS